MHEGAGFEGNPWEQMACTHMYQVSATVISPELCTSVRPAMTKHPCPISRMGPARFSAFFDDMSEAKGRGAERNNTSNQVWAPDIEWDIVLTLLISCAPLIEIFFAWVRVIM